MKSISYHSIAVGLVFIIIFKISVSLKFQTNARLFQYENEMLGDFAKTVVEPKSNIGKYSYKIFFRKLIQPYYFP